MIVRVRDHIKARGDQCLAARLRRVKGRIRRRRTGAERRFLIDQCDVRRLDIRLDVLIKRCEIVGTVAVACILEQSAVDQIVTDRDQRQARRFVYRLLRFDDGLRQFFFDRRRAGYRNGLLRDRDLIVRAGRHAGMHRESDSGSQHRAAQNKHRRARAVSAGFSILLHLEAPSFPCCYETIVTIFASFVKQYSIFYEKQKKQTAEFPQRSVCLLCDWMQADYFAISATMYSYAIFAYLNGLAFAGSCSASTMIQPS